MKVTPFFILTLLFGYSLLASGQENDSQPAVDPVQTVDQNATNHDLFVKETRDEIERLCQTEIALLIEAYKGFFELDEATTNQLEQAGRQLVDTYVDSFSDQQFTNLWDDSMIEGEVKGFTINQRECEFAPSDSVNPSSSPTVSVYLYRSTIILGIGVDGASITNFVDDKKRFEPEQSPELREAMMLSDEDLTRFAKHQNEQKLDRVSSLLLSSITISLKLNDDQLDPTQQWIRKSISEAMVNPEIYDAAKSGFELLNDPPEFFTEDQRAVFELIKASIN